MVSVLKIFSKIDCCKTVKVWYNIHGFNTFNICVNVILMKTVLIIDDSAVMRRIMKNIVIANGYQVIGEAKNGKIGVEKFKELHPDIVTMDVTMDEMNGIDALRQIMKYNLKAKVIMVSSMGQDVIVREAIMLGAKGFILKPFDGRQVLDAFKRL